MPDYASGSRPPSITDHAAWCAVRGDPGRASCTCGLSIARKTGWSPLDSALADSIQKDLVITGGEHRRGRHAGGCEYPAGGTCRCVVYEPREATADDLAALQQRARAGFARQDGDRRRLGLHTNECTYLRGFECDCVVTDLEPRPETEDDPDSVVDAEVIDCRSPREAAIDDAVITLAEVSRTLAEHDRTGELMTIAIQALGAALALRRL